MKKCINAGLTPMVGRVKIYINHDNCKGCGQCVASCPQKALTAEIDNVDEALAELNLRIKERITID